MTRKARPLGMTAFLLFSGVLALATPSDLTALRGKASLLESLTAQLHQLFLRGDEKIKETEVRMAESPFLCQGRLTTEPGVPVSTAARTNQSTIYFTPYQGSRVALYTGTVWTVNAFTERSLVLSGLTISRNYDVFIYNNAGTLTLELSAAWASATARTDALVKQDGVYVKSGATTRRYLGTFRATAATQTQDSLSQRFVWNYYNRVRRPLNVTFNTTRWTYGLTSAFRSVANDNTYRVEYVTGENEIPVHMRAMVVTDSTRATTDIALALGLDATTTPITLNLRGSGGDNDIRQQMWTEATEPANGLGYHFLQSIEGGDNTAIFYGVDTTASPRLQAGMIGWLDG